MFLCEKCLENNYENFAIPFSRGKCDHCEEVEVCVDIPSKYLVEKKNKMNLSTNE